MSGPPTGICAYGQASAASRKLAVGAELLGVPSAVFNEAPRQIHIQTLTLSFY